MRKLRDIMTKDIQYVTPQDNVYEAAVLMKDYNIGSVPIMDSDRLIGVLTDRDIAVRCTASKKPGSTQVTDVMSRNVITGHPDMSVDEASKLMASYQIRRLPVVEQGRLVGYVALGDLAVHNDHRDEASDALSEISESYPPTFEI
ncbi:CBS domain-containing protein [Rubeoparvulum massiliense]|uniref:CBS domain-containing protein n=1 Tax=Rubeoparvulum massiliense TaxID=1631346 RepID=UPI00065E3711|nr:CBS domain-containing protein [Rubeoparvulum massiliense]